MAKMMMDIALTEGEDLDLSSGDFGVIESTHQHQRQLLLNNKGDFKQNPTVGVGLFSYFDDEQFQNLIRAVSMEFSRDGMNVTSIRMGADGVLHSKAVYA